MGTRRALKELGAQQDEVLNDENLKIYSAKMAKIVYNMHHGPGKEGKKFVYSNFRTLEGVEIFTRVLNVRGYEQFNPSNQLKRLNHSILPFEIVRLAQHRFLLKAQTLL